MTDYISRKAALESVITYGRAHKFDDNPCIVHACANLERRINSIPAADVRPVVRSLCEEKQPPQGRYLCVKRLFNGDFSYDVCSFAEDLSKVDKYDFPKNLYKGIGGWFDHDSETGYFRTSVYAWMPLPPFYNCGG